MNGSAYRALSLILVLGLPPLAGCATWTERTDAFVLRGRAIDSVTGAPLAEARVSLLDDVALTTIDGGGQHTEVLEDRPVLLTLTDVCGDFELVCDLRALVRRQSFPESTECVLQDFRLLIEKEGYVTHLGRFTGFPCLPRTLKIGSMEMVREEAP